MSKGKAWVSTSSVFNAFDSMDSFELSIAKFEARINAIKKIAKNQVDLSKKSVVFWTPPSCWVPPQPKDE